ncbi:MAG: 4-alpha-glucanotransferase [Elusimicrobiota bacterium]|jgi:4-alpha-glucanotransferase|nr:4-alpha-glucanotransferase [Elusimicrobiota bacterium]
MKIEFNIDYHTKFGESLTISYIHNGKEDSCPMSTTDGNTWKGEILFPQTDAFELKYTYIVYNDHHIANTEWGEFPHKILLQNQNHPQIYIAYDTWLALAENAYLYTTASKNSFFPCAQKKKDFYKENVQRYAQSLFLSIDTVLKDNQTLLLCGSMQDWDLERSIVLSENENCQHTVCLDASKIDFPFEYKFIIYDSSNNSYNWQVNDNYVLSDLPVLTDGNFAAVISNIRPTFSFNPPRAAGMIVPVFSLRTENDFGVGDFGDIKMLVDWAVKCGIKAIQILPINDTTSGGTWMDASPYTGISVFALHPIYIDLNQLPLEKDAAYFALQKELNDLDYFDYEQVNKAKRKFMQEAFAKEGSKVFESAGYKEFFDKNKDWLEPYAVFSYLRDKNSTSDFSKWQTNTIYNKEEAEKLCNPKGSAFKQVSFYYYIQYTLHCQLLDSANYARSNGIIIKGDIPIGISACSVDTWVCPQYFNMDASAGAPPDIFSLTGQNWGFPTYNWDLMQKEGYTWWKKRLGQMAQYFDAYRIDHILGFFRIWQIPKDSVYGLLGQFSPALAMSKEEIEQYGFNFHKKYLKPYISDHVLSSMFENLADDIKEKYLIKNKEGLYDLIPDFDTQKKIEAAFGNKTDNQSVFIREKLYSLVSNVLFLQDCKDSDKYHPRILAEIDYAFKALSKDEQDAFTKVYNYYFYERHNEFWYKEALKKLPALLQSTQMLVCAEDLGMIPECVPKVLKELQILSLEIERYPKHPGESFGNVYKYPYLSVCSISTHDTSTFRGFWKENADITERFYHHALEGSGAPPKNANSEICRRVLKRNLGSSSMLCMFLFQDWLSIDEKLAKADIDSERINTPGSIHGSWKYRIHLPIERLIMENELNKNIKDLIQSSNR